LNASNGLDRITPPKSHRTARMDTVDDIGSSYAGGHPTQRADGVID
jgi:hypothetical protein